MCCGLHEATQARSGKAATDVLVRVEGVLNDWSYCCCAIVVEHDVVCFLLLQHIVHPRLLLLQRHGIVATMKGYHFWHLSRHQERVHCRNIIIYRRNFATVVLMKVLFLFQVDRAIFTQRIAPVHPRERTKARRTGSRRPMHL